VRFRTDEIEGARGSQGDTRGDEPPWVLEFDLMMVRPMRAGGTLKRSTLWWVTRRRAFRRSTGSKTTRGSNIAAAPPHSN